MLLLLLRVVLALRHYTLGMAINSFTNLNYFHGFRTLI